MKEAERKGKVQREREGNGRKKKKVEDRSMKR